jgi:hypothetical protein
MSYTIVQEVGSDTSLIVQDVPLAPTIIEIITPGPQGPAGATGSGIAISQTVSSAASLPTGGTPGQSILVADTGRVYTWSNT